MSEQARKSDIPASAAIALLGIVLSAILVWPLFRSGELSLSVIEEWQRRNEVDLLLGGIAFLVNVLWIGSVIVRGAKQQGSRLKKMAGAGKSREGLAVGRCVWAANASLATYLLAPALFGRPFINVTDLGALDLSWLRVSMTVNGLVAVSAASYVGLKAVTTLRLGAFFRGLHLADPPKVANGVVLGADESDGESPTWVAVGRKALNGNVLVTGSIGSGKTQGTILPYFDQILANFTPSPTVLLIDPKGTFAAHALAIAERHGLSDRILHIRLGGNVSYNPVYRADLLKGGRAVEVAQMLRAAAINSIGRSQDGAFWEISSFNLMKNALVYCASVLGYYTLNDLYRTIVAAPSGDLAQDLERVLKDRDFDEEERFTVEQALAYLNGELTQFEDRVRSGILATATAFLNQFQDFQVGQIFCPEEGNATLASLDEAVDAGKIIVFDVKVSALARAIGTIIKLQFQESLLKRLTDPGRPSEHAGVLVIDEYQDVATSGHGVALGDERFLAKGREANTISIMATQSLTSLENSIGRDKAARELMQNFRTRIVGPSTDLYTIRSFQELAGEKEVDRLSHSLSETSQDARPNLFLGGFDSERANISESISRTKQKEFKISVSDFASLKSFECFAQVYDGLSVEFRRLCLKPYFLTDKSTSHARLMEALRPALVALAVSIGLGAESAVGTPMPTLCSVVATPEFEQCMALTIGGCMCPGTPPRPCALISYYRPETFVEVVPEAGTSFFSPLPGVASQLSSVAHKKVVPFGVEGEVNSHAFHAHVLDVPLASLVGRFMPCAGMRSERACFDAMSEHLDDLWVTGAADLHQPGFLATLAAPKACLLAGAAQSTIGGGLDAGYSPGSATCSVPMSSLRKFPPSTHSACTGWGTFFPRTGTYDGPSSTTAALMVAARMKSLGNEVFQSTPKHPDEKWQMLQPQSSMCFREGQNATLVEAAGVREMKRLGGGPLTGFVFTIWRRATCCRDIPDAAALRARISALKAACAGGGT